MARLFLLIHLFLVSTISAQERLDPTSLDLRHPRACAVILNAIHYHLDPLFELRRIFGEGQSQKVRKQFKEILDLINQRLNMLSDLSSWNQLFEDLQKSKLFLRSELLKILKAHIEKMPSNSKREVLLNTMEAWSKTHVDLSIPCRACSPLSPPSLLCADCEAILQARSEFLEAYVGTLGPLHFPRQILAQTKE